MEAEVAVVEVCLYVRGRYDFVLRISSTLGDPLLCGIHSAHLLLLAF